MRAWQPGPRAYDALRWMLLALLIAYWAVLLRPPVFGGVTQYVFVKGTSMEPTYSGGDLVVIRKQARYEVGDVVTYTPSGTHGHVIHRVVAVDDGRYTLKGDNRGEVDIWHPTAADINGKPLVAVPRAGLLLMALAASPLAQALLSGLTTFAVVAFSGRDRRARPARRRGGGGGRTGRPRGRGRVPTPSTRP